MAFVVVWVGIHGTANEASFSFSFSFGFGELLVSLKAVEAGNSKAPSVTRRKECS